MYSGYTLNVATTFLTSVSMHHTEILKTGFLYLDLSDLPGIKQKFDSTGTDISFHQIPLLRWRIASAVFQEDAAVEANVGDFSINLGLKKISVRQQTFY